MSNYERTGALAPISRAVGSLPVQIEETLL